MPLPNGLPTPMEVRVSTIAGASPTSIGEPRYSLPQEVLRRTRDLVGPATRRSRRKALALAAQVTYLAVMEPDSGASTQDRLKAADGAARVSGLTRDDQVKVTVTFTMRGWGSPPTKVIDASPVPPLPDGAGGARGEGG